MIISILEAESINLHKQKHLQNRSYVKMYFKRRNRNDIITSLLFVLSLFFLSLMQSCTLYVCLK